MVLSLPRWKISFRRQQLHLLIQQTHITAPIAGPHQRRADEDVAKKWHQQRFAQTMEKNRHNRNCRVALGQARDAAFETLQLLRLAPASLREHDQDLAV